MVPGAEVPEIVNVGDGMGYPCILRGYGVIRGYEPMLSYHRDAPTLRRAREGPGYRGEAWTAEEEIRPVHWSPNRLVFHVRPGQEVFINQNPGSWWRANGRRIFTDRRCAEPMLPFAVRADDSGRLELRIDPPGLGTGMLFHLIGAGCSSRRRGDAFRSDMTRRPPRFRDKESRKRESEPTGGDPVAPDRLCIIHT